MVDKTKDPGDISKLLGYAASSKNDSSEHLSTLLRGNLHLGKLCADRYYEHELPVGFPVLRV